MGVMGYLRERMGKILAICIGFSLFAFIVGEVIRSGGSFFRDDRNMLGEIYGQKIAYDEFQKRVDQNSAQFRQQSGEQALTPQITSYVQQTTWNQMLAQFALQSQVQKLGLQVGDDETKSMISGDNPAPQVVQYFGDPQTGKLDRNKLNNFLQQLPGMSPQIQEQWGNFIDELVQAKLSEKYITLVTNGLYVNSLEAKDEYENKNKLVNFKYVTLPYSSIPDNKVNPTDGDYQNYYDAHKAEFDNPQETRSFDYVSFDAIPTKADTDTIMSQANKIAAAFKITNNDSLFVQINAETKTNPVYRHKGQSGDPKLDSIMFNEPNGFIYGPYLSNGSYKIAKLIDAHMEPDSVQARHILIDASTIGHDKAVAKADSLKKLVESGKSFADLAKVYSLDKSSAVKGGELGTFARGAMVPSFENAVFSGKKGDLKVVTTQYGVHLIQIENTKGMSKVAKIAVVDIPLKPSNETESAMYSKAQSFLASLTKDNFDAQAKKFGVKKQAATDVSGIAGSLPGIDNARDIVRWAYGAEKGDLTDKVYISGDQYIVAQLTQIKPKGTLPLEDVKNQIAAMVINEVKGKMLDEKLQPALSGSTTIDQVAQKSGAKVNPVENMVFANPVLPGIAPEYKLAGAVFGSQPGKLSKPVNGAQGVYVFSVDNFTNPAPLTNAVREKEQISQAILQRAQGEIFQALEDKGNVKDYRTKFL